MQDGFSVSSRSSDPSVRNPLLALPAVADLQALPQASQTALRAVLKDLSADARVRAEKCWRSNKPPLAAYWKAVAVYANHTSRLLAKDARHPRKRVRAQTATGATTGTGKE